VALVSTQPLLEISTKDICWGSRWPLHRAYNLATFMRRLSRNSEKHNLLEHKGNVQACVKDCFAFCQYIRVLPYHKPWTFSCPLDIRQ